MDLAILPGAALLVYMYKKDKVDREPLSLLILLLIGGLLSCVTSIYMELTVDKYILSMFTYDTMIYWFMDAFVCAALCEELSKYFFLNIISWRNKNFNCSFDGLLYAVVVSLGFAIGENILYVVEGGVDVGIARIFTAIPAHMAFSIAMGIFYTNSKMIEKYGNPSKAKMIKTMGLLTAIIIHGLYDFFLFASTDFLYTLWLIMMVAIYVIGYIAINVFSKNDRYF